MRITIYGNGALSNVVTALSVFARLEYPRAVVRCQITHDVERLTVEQDEGESVVHRFEHALKEVQHARDGLLIEFKDEEMIRAVAN
jgi:hypothetical protein